ncbi:hypothetical protein IH575_02710 [Candidatus Dojkabacteria bacterium]|nr:hypothetical protein [Candidatus Dojkabacteria bacterium]
MGFIRSIENFINGLKIDSDSNSTDDKRIDDSNLEKIANLEHRIVSLENKILQFSDLPQKYSDLKKEVEKLTFTFNAKNANHNSHTSAQQNLSKKSENESKVTPTPQKPTTEFHYIKLMNMKGDVEMIDVNKSDAFYELITLRNTAELRPLSEKSSYLIMQQKYLLEPAFTISGSGQNISVQTSAKYELQSGNLWNIIEKGKIELK